MEAAGTAAGRASGPGVSVVPRKTLDSRERDLLSCGHRSGTNVSEVPGKPSALFRGEQRKVLHALGKSLETLRKLAHLGTGKQRKRCVRARFARSDVKRGRLMEGTMVANCGS